MAKYETISVKVSSDLKAKLAQYGVKTGEVVRSALEEEVRRRQLEEIEKRLDAIRPALEKIGTEDIVASIREDRMRR